MNIIDTLTKKQLAKCITKSFSNNEIIYNEADECISVGIVKKGSVYISSYLENGKEVIYNTITENEMFGNNLIFSTNTTYKGNVISKDDSEILFINKNDLIDILMDNKQFLLEYLKIQSNFVKNLNNNIKLLAMSSAEDRLLYLLHINNNYLIYDSISSLSKTLFLERETTSRLISKLVKEKKIYKDKNIIYKV